MFSLVKQSTKVAADTYTMFWELVEQQGLEPSIASTQPKISQRDVKSLVKLLLLNLKKVRFTNS
eukprot:gene2898-5688_t